MSLKRIIRKVRRLNKKQRTWLCALALLLLIGLLLLCRFLDGGGVEGDVEFEGETLPIETVQTTEG